MIDQDTIQDLRKNFSAEKCITALFNCATKLAGAIGVKVSWSIDEIGKPTVDRETIQVEFGKLTAIIGALAAGSRFNPLQYAKEREHAAQLHRQTADHFSPKQKDDQAGEGS